MAEVQGSKAEAATGCGPARIDLGLSRQDALESRQWLAAHPKLREGHPQGRDHRISYLIHPACSTGLR